MKYTIGDKVKIKTTGKIVTVEEVGMLGGHYYKLSETAPFLWAESQIAECSIEEQILYGPITSRFEILDIR